MGSDDWGMETALKHKAGAQFLVLPGLPTRPGTCQLLLDCCAVNPAQGPKGAFALCFLTWGTPLRSVGRTLLVAGSVYRTKEQNPRDEVQPPSPAGDENFCFT